MRVDFKYLSEIAEALSHTLGKDFWIMPTCGHYNLMQGANNEICGGKTAREMYNYLRGMQAVAYMN